MGRRRRDRWLVGAGNDRGTYSAAAAALELDRLSPAVPQGRSETQYWLDLEEKRTLFQCLGLPACSGMRVELCQD